MGSTRTRMIVVAMVVCLFAVGMATFLNYFKYRSTADRIVKGRMAVIGKSIENSVQASLSLGLSFSDLDMLPAHMERELATDPTILGINVFDTAGTPLYATDRLRGLRTAPAAWTAAARSAGDVDWFVNEGAESAVGISIRNNFGLTIGMLVLRYSNEKIDQATRTVAKELAIGALMVFAGAALLASLALRMVFGRLERSMQDMEEALRSPQESLSEMVAKGPFGPSLQQYLQSIRMAEAQIEAVRGTLSRGGER